MEVIGGVSSVLALIKAAAILVRATREVTRRLIDAPDELHEVAAQLMILQSELEHFQRISCDAHKELLDLDVREEIEETLVQARDAVNFIDGICGSPHGSQGIVSRVRWASKGRKAVDEGLARLQAARRRLKFLLTIFSYRTQSLMLDKVNEVKSIVLSHGNNKDKQYEISGDLEIVSDTQKDRRKLLWKPWSLGPNWAGIGIRGSLIPTEQGSYIDYSIAMQLSLPLARIVGPYALMMSVCVRTFPLCPGNFTFLEGGNIIFSRVVGEDHPFIMACDRGDLLAVRCMLRNREGRPTDTVERNWNPLAFAIRSGNVDVVKELLAHGANINGTFGQLQTTPLQWAIWQKQLDIVRLLLTRGASQDHLNTLGWNTTFYCWPKLAPAEQDMLSFINLLEEYSYQDLDVADTEGWTALHRVAAYATPSDVLRLIKLGADPAQVALPLRWNAIQHAVEYGNHAAFSVLVPYYSDDITSMTDERGWTLLHIAAFAGHDEIVRDLLQLGANPVARSKPFRSHMPECLFGRECTPQEVAAAQSTEREGRYLDALRDLELLKNCVLEAEVDDEYETEFWDANEKL